MIAPRLSVVIPTMHGWPAVWETLESVLGSAERVGAEVLVVDGSGGEPPPGLRCRWIAAAPLGVGQLRTDGLRNSSGEIVAVTEDHCNVPVDWCERVLEAHSDFPSALAIGGAVANGATERALDRASFLVVQHRAMPPVVSGPATRLASVANVSYKRAALDRLAQGRAGEELDHILRAEGAEIRSDPRLAVTHVQSLGWWRTTAAHFHAARTMTGCRRARMSGTDWIRLAAAPLLPLLRVTYVARSAVRKGYGRDLFGAAPHMLWLVATQTVGQVAGYLAGPGRSPLKIE